MKFFSVFSIISVFFLTGFYSPPTYVSLFDGKTFHGWEGDTSITWKIENGTLVGGSMDKMVPQNNFLCTKRSYANFILKLKVKLTGSQGFINSGIQFRSQRMTEPANEMKGYQADWGEGFWETLYDESRRNKTIAGIDPKLTQKNLKLNDWNDYQIRAENRKIRLYVNGHKTVDYTEPDAEIPQEGHIGFQVHGGGITQVAFKEIFIKVLP